MSKYYSDFNSYHGERLREIRTLRGFTPLQLALLSGVDRSYITRIENHSANISLYVLHQLCMALQITESEFFQFNIQQ
jgi:transcriptional regulator with XRE-family HTH domain